MEIEVLEAGMDDTEMVSGCCSGGTTSARK